MMLMNKVALITGASRGIGKEIALKFAQNGAHIIFFYKNNAALAHGTAKEIQKLGRKVLPIQVDVSDYASVSEAREIIRRHFDGIDILVNNAGLFQDSLFVNMSQEQWNTVIHVNLTGTFHCTRIFVDELFQSRGGGCVINMASIAGIYGNIGQTNYSASKSGIIGFTKALAKEVASKNIRVNAIAPGFIETGIWDGLPDHILEKALKKIALKRVGTAADVANVALFLASDYAGYITGQVIDVDGGIGLSVL
ncbi:3-oxoacyl-[acyl-carrier-protein] reductase [Thermotalea metallivorans]|uniref:3-oxoacyl-[acyl-carrier-protein] reductase n=1 Tax=Thermotalea metallivorans TaxID=520762 RepID=A0A140L7A5_9FIRM|nr:3-oxoacyl-[acyl-carrier-protein] reductase [Thermotalea metallivorans]KXG76430.1 3-oxoacyl-[acyl-carrier-protein] reductase FabG [Thermotalea metallivorans]